MAGQTGTQDIARRYALAFFALTKEQGQMDAVSADLRNLQKMLLDSGDLRKFIGNAALRRDAQARAMAALAEKAGFSALTRKFLGTLAAKRRLAALPEIVAAVQSEIARLEGEVTAEVTAAAALDAAQVDGIAAALKKALGMTVKIDLKQDADIMGGLIIRIGSQRIDGSVRAKLERLHRVLKGSDTSGSKAKMREVA